MPVCRIKRRLFGKGKISPKDAEVPEVLADTSGHVPSTEREVSPEPTTSAASPHYKQHRPVTTVRVMTIRHKCVLKKRTIKTTVIPLDTDGPQIISGTSKETYIKTEEIHENSTTFSSRKQGELPVMMVEVESRKHTIIPENDENTLRRDGRTMTEENSSEVNCRNRRRVIPENDENTLRQDGRTMTEENSSEVHCRNRRRISPLLKRIQQREAIPHTDVMTPEICKFYSIEIPNEKVIPENDENTLRRDGRTTTEENSSEVHCRNQRRVLPEETEIKVEKVEKRKFNCFTSFFRRFCRKKIIIPQVTEEPPATPVAVPGSGSASDEIIQTQEEDTKDAPDIKQLFSKEEEIDHSTEGAWEEDQSDLSGAISVPESRQMLQITSVVFGNRDAPELQLRELGKESSPIAPEINVLYQAPPKSSNEDMNEEEEEEEEEVVVEEPVEEFPVEEEAATDEEAETEEEEEAAAPKAEAGEAEEEEEEEVVELEAAGEEAEEEKEEEEEGEEGG
ncbi:uncharacterized protein LOC143268226 [Peromyscus maniculatus bairdii]|uniref:uncharacterized protein LOC143268226 n=1 Tax=Peromyscus maniculatus bairdii TaxID=230844 RepID=UPI003FCFBCA6